MIAVVEAADEILGVHIFEEKPEGERMARHRFQTLVNEFLDTHHHDGERQVLKARQRIWRSKDSDYYIMLVKGAEINPR